MRKERKAARDMCNALKSADELRTLLDSLNITDEEREIAYCVLSRGWSYTRTAMEYGMTYSQVRRRMDRVYSKM